MKSKLLLTVTLAASILPLAACSPKKQDVKQLDVKQNQSTKNSKNSKTSEKDVEKQDTDDASNEKTKVLDKDGSGHDRALSDVDKAKDIQFGDDTIKVKEPDKEKLNSVTNANTENVDVALADDDAQLVATDGIKRLMTSLSNKDGNPAFVTLSDEWLDKVGGKRFRSVDLVEKGLRILNKSTKEGKAWPNNIDEIATPKEGDTYTLQSAEWTDMKKDGSFVTITAMVRYKGGSIDLKMPITFVINKDGVITSVW